MSDVPILGFIIGLLVVLFGLWVYLGGPERYETEGRFIVPHTEEGGGNTYNERLVSPDSKLGDFIDR